MNRWVGKVAVVTGASAGIGLATVKSLVKEGMIVVGLARRKEKMESEMENFEGKGKFYALKCDVSKESDVNETFEWVKENLKTIHVLVNNAGIVIPGQIIDTNREVWEQVINVNVLGLLQCSQQAVKIMKESGEECHIININSITGHRIIKSLGMSINVYTASKYAVTAITSTLETELLGTKIRTTSISPGVVKTEIIKKLPADQFEKFAALPTLEPEDISESIIYVLGTPQRVQITELEIRPLGETY